MWKALGNIDLETQSRQLGDQVSELLGKIRVA